MEFNSDLIKKAYKKLKSSIYFDKTQLILRDKIVQFECKNLDIDQYLEELWLAFENKTQWDELKNEILESIKVISLPKKLKPEKQTIIINSVSDYLDIEELQHFIDMDVRGHIFGVIWLLMIGWRLDEQIYEHSYGNRIRKNLINEMADGATYSPYLFEPYFQQYESWRDTALSYADKCLERNQDVVIITMDFRRFYYSVDLTEAAFENILEITGRNIEDSPLYERINKFIFEVITAYAGEFNPTDNDGRNILPIGFLPSNILANWCLNNFDKAIIDGWNPLYYGRYVDDILIIDKVEKDSEIFRKANRQELSRSEIIRFFLEQCSRWKGFIPKCENTTGFSLLIEDTKLTKKAILEAKKKKESTEDIHVYVINPIYNITINDKSNVIIHNDKVKIFYFKHGESDALLNCFRNNISKNKSEFRYMPEDEAVFQDDDYSEIYCLYKSDSINKLRGVDGISIDKFALSKFLGKLLRIGGMINDKVESKFEKDILKIFNTRTIIENYTTWEKVIEIFVINNKFDVLLRFVSKIIHSVKSINYPSNPDTEKNVKRSLLKILRSAIAKSFSISWGGYCSDSIEKVYDIINIEFSTYSKHFSLEKMIDLRKKYCETRMCDKYVLPIMIDVLLNVPHFIFNDKKDINFTNFLQITSLILNIEVSIPDYKYYPYIVTTFDISMVYTLKNLITKSEIDTFINDLKMQKKKYLECNYVLNIKKQQCIDNLVKMEPLNDCPNNYVIKVGDDKKDTLRFAIANVQVHKRNFEKVVKDTPNRNYKRYKDISLLVNKAIKEKADMLVMPESFIPFEWLPTIARTCAKNQIAIVTGVEHIKIEDRIYNLTAVILPYKEEDYNSVYLSFHLKRHYAPLEVQEIKGYRLIPVFGMGYELYCWNDCWFPVYCCYELASIKDRCLFQSYLDVLIAVEWNSDTNYYSNILESLSRDLHCYCVQVNSANYGDSRITKPSKTENKDIIRTKGGINSTILIDEVDIKLLREFQFKEFELQKKDCMFKPTPPEFDTSVVFKKMKKKLWDYLTNN